MILLVGIPLCSFGQTDMIALVDLKTLLYSEKEWVKVHVAEFLIWEDCDVDEVRTEFMKEEQQFGHLPKYRIGIWRVLAQAATDEKERQYWVDKIFAAYNDVDGEDRLHAIETLAKLKVPVTHELRENLEGLMRLYTLWNYTLVSEKAQEEVKRTLIGDLIGNRLDELDMQVASYILRYMDPLSAQELTEIRSWMEDKDIKPSLRCNLLSTLLISSAEDQKVAEMDDVKRELISFRNNPGALNHIMMVLAVCGNEHDKVLINELFQTRRDNTVPGYNSDLHATAAYMVLKVWGKVVRD